jgi:hypothetical protein
MWIGPIELQVRVLVDVIRKKQKIDLNEPLPGLKPRVSGLLT